MEWYLYAAVVGAGFLAGFINTLAGSGSLITLPLLMFIGLPANVANGTNRIGILLQSVVGVATFKQKKALDIQGGIWLTLPAIVGSVIGAQFAVKMDNDLMEKCIGALLFVMFLLVLFKPSVWIKGKAGNVTGKKIWIQSLIFFIIGLYGGFIQAGVGFFLLAGLVLSAGFDLVKANALKLFIVLIYTPFALAVFVFNQQIDYKIGLILAIGNMAGAWVASLLAVKKGAEFVRWILLAILVLASLKLLLF